MNYELLDEVIKDSPYKKSYVLAQIGLDDQSYWQRKNRGTEFKPSEIAQICETLGIGDDMRKLIFLI